jgi:hypothetical protein
MLKKAIVRSLPILRNEAHRAEIAQGLEKLRAALDDLALSQEIRYSSRGRAQAVTDALNPHSSTMYYLRPQQDMFALPKLL